MPQFLPKALTDATVPPDVAVDAAYFVIRTLRNRLRGYRILEVSPESPALAYALAVQALAEIQQTEGLDLEQMSETRARQYIEAIERRSRELFAVASGEEDVDMADDLLEQLRAEHRRPAA